MKNNLRIFLVCVFVVFAFSCKTVQKKDENFLGDFDPVSLDKVMAAIVPRVKKELSPREFSFLFEPRTNTLAFHHRYIGDNIWISLDYDARQIMIKAINQYLEAFKNGELNETNDKKKALFGQTPSYMKWGLLGLAHEAKPTLRFEYQLVGKKKLPYFIVAAATQKALRSDANSPAIRIALSPAKCQEFLQRLDQENLLKLVKEMQAEFEKFAPEDGFGSDTAASEIEKNSSESNKSVDPDEAEFGF